MADLKNYRVIEREPVCAPYREYEVCGMGAPSSGAIALGEILGVLQNQDMKALGAENIHSWRWIGDASRIAFADRDYYVGDPKFVNVPTRALISQAYLKPRAEEIRKAEKALENIQAGQFGKAYAQGMAVELPSTSHLVVVDKDGNVVSMTTSIENAFGSGLMANGYLLNNELTDFAFNPVGADGKTVANSVAGGKRPRSSMAPTIVMKDGKPYLAVGSPGGRRIIGSSPKRWWRISTGAWTFKRQSPCRICSIAAASMKSRKKPQRRTKRQHWKTGLQSSNPRFKFRRTRHCNRQRRFARRCRPAPRRQGYGRLILSV